MTRLDGKSIIITGAGSGLGLDYALACARAGASVVVNDVNADAARLAVEQITSDGGDAYAFSGSVASWEDNRRLVEAALERYGALDGFVANAAIMHMGSPWQEDEDRLRRIAEVNVLGTQFGIHHAMGAMVDSGRGGSIVTIVSGAMHGILGMSAYGASKGAVGAMTLNWALEGAEHGIRVNAVSPWALTKMTLDHLDQSKADPTTFPTADAIAPVVVALLSDDTASVNGKLIRFDGAKLSFYETLVTRIDESDSWTADDVSVALTSRLGQPA